MNINKDYYRILGVLDDAEDIVIRAAYRALAQRYHPDKCEGNPEVAAKRMAEINEAYSILSDADKRKEHDQNRAEKSFETDLDSELDNELEGDWLTACEYFPDLKEMAGNLSKISSALGATFKLLVLAKREFNDRKNLASLIENEYLEKYFGSDFEIKSFARYLLITRKIDAAKTLNKDIRILGSSVPAKTIISNIKEKYSLSTKHNIYKLCSFLEKNDLAELGKESSRIFFDLISDFEKSTNLRVEVNFLADLNKGWIPIDKKEVNIRILGIPVSMNQKQFLKWLREYKYSDS